MARSWQELFATGEEAGGRRRRRRSSAAASSAVSATTCRRRARRSARSCRPPMFQSLDEEAFERLEETLIYADVGAPTTARIVERLEAEAAGGRADRRRGPHAAPHGAARRHRAARGRHHPAERQAHGDPHDRGERQRQDHHDRQDGLAPAEGAGPLGAARRRRHLPRRRRRAAHDRGRSAPAARSCAATRAPIRAPWSSTPSTRPRRVGATWSSWTRPAACTPSST